MAFFETFCPVGVVLGFLLGVGFAFGAGWGVFQLRKRRVRKTELSQAARCRSAFHQMGHVAVAFALNEEVTGCCGESFEAHRFLERGELKRCIAVLLGGRAAEAIFFDEVSTGASHDLELASQIASDMIWKYGMGVALGLFVDTHARNEAVSEHTAQTVDSEIRGILDSGFQLASRLIEENRSFVEAGASLFLQGDEPGPERLRRMWSDLRVPAGEMRSPVAEEARTLTVH